MMKKLLNPFQIKHLTLPNRIVMAPMATDLTSEKGRVTEKLVDYYQRRAQGETGMIIVEAATVEPRGFAFPREFRIYIWM